MSKKQFYLCENEYGDDPCEWAIEGRKISPSEVTVPLEGNPTCPGLTRSGKECGQKLVLINGGGGGGNSSSIIKKRMLIGSVILAFTFIICLVILGRGGTPQLIAEPTTLIFPKSQDGEFNAGIRINNPGDGELEIENITVQPAAFSVAETEMKIEKESGATLIVTFNSPSNEMVEGTLQFHSNATDKPVTIRMIANQDPWWVYKKLEASSKILFTEK